jgi:hypothetical protein
MKVGETIPTGTNVISFYDTACAVTSSTVYPISVTLESHHPSMDLGGDIGVQDVIVLRYDYPGPLYERFYYSATWGWVKWEWYDGNGSVIGSAVFNLFAARIPPGPGCST